MKFFFPVSLAVSIIFSFIAIGCNPSSSDNGKATLRGIVVDTSIPSRPIVPGARVFLEQINDTTQSDSAGIFTFTNLTGGVYAVYVSKPGYTNFSTTVEVLADTTTLLTTPLLNKNIYAFNDIVINLNSAGNFRNGYSVPDDSRDKDIQLRDTVTGTGTLVYIRSADQDLINQGYQTWFSNRYVSNYTHFQFDTISEYRTIDGIRRPDNGDFPNHNGLDSLIDVNSNQHPVWFFYLKGRNLTPRVFGVMYLDSAWYDAGLDLRVVRFDIRINANDKYDFNLYNKK
jgi:hypothetical protein